MNYLTRLLFFATVLLFYACGRDSGSALYHAPLAQKVTTSMVDRGQVFYGVGDTLAFREWVAGADSVTHRANQITYHRPEGQYQVLEHGPSRQLRSPFPVPHFERTWDTIARTVNLIRMLDNQRVKAYIDAADFVLGRDSVRLGVIRVLGSAFGLRADTIDYPDYLLVTTYGNDHIPIAMDQDNVGPITRQTVFRVGRRYYVLRSIGEDYADMTVEELPEARGLPLTAELETTFKSVPVMDMDGEKATVKHEKGKELLLYFWGLGSRDGEDITTLHTAYEALPPAERERLRIVLINVNNKAEDVRAFLGENGVDFPSYRSTGKTCLRLNCHPSLPYYVTVSPHGRILSYHQRPEVLLDRWATTFGVTAGGGGR